MDWRTGSTTEHEANTTRMPIWIRWEREVKKRSGGVDHGRIQIGFWMQTSFLSRWNIWPQFAEHATPLLECI